MCLSNECGGRLNLRRMDRFISMIMVLADCIAQRNELELHIRERGHDNILTASGCQLRAAYLPTLAKPLPSELQHLIAQLVTFESDKRGSTERSIERLQSAAGTAVVIKRGANRTTD
jgi:hypothetical protein